MIRDKFYIGIIEMDEHEIKGVFHERLIDDATFYKCQEVADKRAHKNDKKRKTENEDFTLRGPLLCPACGNKLTAAWCQGNTKKYPKYYCIHKGCPLKSKTYKREDVHTGFYNLLLKIQPKDNLTGLFDEIFMRRYKERITELEGDSIRAKNELDTLEAEKMSVIQMLKKGQLLDDEFQTLIQPIRDKIAIARLNFNEVKTDASEIEVCLAYGEKFIQTAALVWFDASPKLKMKIQSMIFPNGLNTTLDVFQTTIYPYLSS